MTIDFPTTVGALGKFLGARVIGDDDLQVTALSDLEGAEAGCLSFLSDQKLRASVSCFKGSVLLTREEWVDPSLPLTFLVVAEPQLAFARLAKICVDATHCRGVSPLAIVDPSAIIAEGVSIGPLAVVSRGAKVGQGAVLFSHVYVGDDVEIGENCEIHSHVVLERKVQLGNRVKIFGGSVIGSDGFGLIPSADGTIHEMPHIGTVVVEDDVRIGANCTIDRATLGETRIGKGTKIDNQVHIAHNVTIGESVILCGHVAIAGSVTLGDRVVLAGQVGVGDHVTIGDGARLGGQTGVGTNLKGGEAYSGSPAIPVRETHKILRLMRKLPELFDRIKALEASK